MKHSKFGPVSGIPYPKMYTTLFNAITDALELIENRRPAEAASLLKRAQQGAEEQYIDAGFTEADCPGAERGPRLLTVPGNKRQHK